MTWDSFCELLSASNDSINLAKNLLTRFSSVPCIMKLTVIHPALPDTIKKTQDEEGTSESSQLPGNGLKTPANPKEDLRTHDTAFKDKLAPFQPSHRKIDVHEVDVAENNNIYNLEKQKDNYLLGLTSQGHGELIFL